MTNIGRRTLIAAAGAGLCAGPALASAADISFVIPYAPGGGFDAYVLSLIHI